MAVIDMSVVIPTFNRPELLNEALRSALSQGVSLEVIVVDDSLEGSAREVVDACADSRVTYLQCHPPSGGKPALVRNVGWLQARGRFIHFLDDDDRVADGFYKAVTDAFQAHPDQGMVFGRIEPFGGGDSDAMTHERAYFDNASRRARLAARIRSRHWMVANLLFAETMLVNSACVVRHECVALVGGYDAKIQLNEDVDFFCRVIRRFGFVFVDRTAVHYRIHSNSLMHGRASNEQLAESYRRMYEQYREGYGAAELFAMKVFSHTVLRVLYG